MTADLRTVVTGAANGIGYAIAERLAARGDRVIGLDIERGDGSTDIVGCDLADGASRVEAVAEATRRLGGIDVLVNAAGVFREGGLLDSGPGDWRSVWAIDLDAAIDLMRLAAPGMVAAGFGRIVNVTSVHAGHGQHRCLAYDVAKAGLEAATRSGALELAPHGVLVNAVAPGFVRTRMSLLPDGSDETDTEAFRAVYVEAGKLPIGRAAAPAEIAEAVAHLAGRENTYVTGHVMTVDGGLTATF